MKWIIFILITALFVILFTALFAPFDTIKKSRSTPVQSQGKITMQITSSAFDHNAPIPSRYTCDGEDVNPALQFEDIPEDAASLVLLVEDPDAPSGTFHHWTVYNMDPSVTGIPEGKRPTGEEGMTDYGKTGYGGPCPPSGTHRYFFKLFALDKKLDLPENATYNEVVNAMENHVIDQAELIGLYSRN